MPTRAGWLLVAALTLVGTVAPAGAQSLWTARSGSLVTDIRASRAGDILTILIDEQSTGSKSADTKLNRDGSFSSSFTPPPYEYPTWLGTILNGLRVAGAGKSDYKGSGSTSRTDRANAQIAARVMRVHDNGTLAIEGRRLVVMHGESVAIVVSGLVRPADVGADNVVRSSAIADGEFRIEGKGAISERQSPGIIQRLFDWLAIF
jgi:flagellar L-ring protein FlgH